MTDEPAPRRETSRLRMMMGHTWLMMIVVGGICLGIAAVAYRIANEPLTLQIAVGPFGSEDVKIAQAIASQLGRDYASVRLKVVETPGTETSATLLSQGKVDLAVVRRDVAMPKEGQAVAILRRNVVVLFAPQPSPTTEPAAAKGKSAKAKAKAKAAKAEKAAPIEKVEDLVGRKVAIIGRTKANLTLLEIILKQYSIPIDKVQVEQIPVDDTSVIKEGKVDAVMALGPVGSRITSDAIFAAMREKEPPTFIPITASEAIAERYPIYEATEIKMGAFGGSPPQPEEALETVGVAHYIVARNDLSEQTVANLARLLYAARAAAAADAPGAAKIEAPETGRGSVVTVHAGAAAYIDGTQKNFFERYSDFIYMGVLLLSVAGSGLAGLMSFSKAGERAERLQVLDRLVALTPEAHAANSSQELDNLTAEVDEIMKSTLQQIEKGDVDDSTLSAFTIALEQARGAIRDRRAILPPEAPLVPARDERRFEVGPRGRAS